MSTNADHAGRTRAARRPECSCRGSHSSATRRAWDCGWATIPADSWYRAASAATAGEQEIVSGAEDAPAELPAQQPRAVLAQASRAEPRSPCQLVRAGFGRDRVWRRARGSWKGAAGEARQHHCLQLVAVDAGRGRHALELLGGQPHPGAAGFEHRVSEPEGAHDLARR
jgi:hypothetical protein